LIEKYETRWEGENLLAIDSWYRKCESTLTWITCRDSNPWLL